MKKYIKYLYNWIGLSVGLIPAFFISVFIDPCSRNGGDFCFKSSEYFGWIWPSLANIFGTVLIFFIERHEKLLKKWRLTGINLLLLLVPYTVLVGVNPFLPLGSIFLIGSVSFSITGIVVGHALLTRWFKAHRSHEVLINRAIIKMKKHFSLKKLFISFVLLFLVLVCLLFLYLRSYPCSFDSPDTDVSAEHWYFKWGLVKE